jgi:thymidylate kinase
MDIDERIAFDRKRDVPSLEYLSTRRKLYLQLARYFDFTVIDATKSLSLIQEQVFELVSRKILYSTS